MHVCVYTQVLLLCVCVETQLLLEEQNFSLREAQRTLKQKALLYLLRFVLNIAVLSLLGGAFYLIYFAITVSQNEVSHWCRISGFAMCVLNVATRRISLTFWAASLRADITGWSVSSSSICLPSPSLLSTCSSLTSSGRSHRLKTIRSPRRSTPPFWGEGRLEINTRNARRYLPSLFFRSIFLKLASLGIYLFFVFEKTEDGVSWVLLKLSSIEMHSTFCCMGPFSPSASFSV